MEMFQVVKIGPTFVNGVAKSGFQKQSVQLSYFPPAFEEFMKYLSHCKCFMLLFHLLLVILL